MIEVETEVGRIEGIRENGIFAFLGVPYAAPVTPDRRFAEPQPVVPWKGVRSAARLGAVCPQIPTYGPVGTAAASRLAFGTDFLTVNIRSPELDGRAPVLVWIHGGGYAVGSANEPALQTGAFAASGIVEVTVNYRLGALGFLRVPGCPDNRGLLDIVAALRFVRDNIAAFGGDPQRVTLAGRSAGGFAVAALMAMPVARGLFARAMPQSGASAGVATPEDAAKLTRRVASALGADHGDLPASMLQALAIDRLLAVQRDLCNQSYEQHDAGRDGAAAMLGVPFVPVVDGASLPEHPQAAAEAGHTARVPMMIGCTTGEYVTHATAHAEMDFVACAALLDQRVRPLGLTGAEIVARYCKALPDHGPKGVWRAVGGDLVFQLPAIRFARAHGRHNPVWKYLYGPVEPDELGASHGAEVGAVWHRRGMDPQAFPERQRVSDSDFAGRVHDLWAQFVCGEAPSPADWPAYGEGMAHVLHLTPEAFASIEDPFAPRETLWHLPAALQTGVSLASAL